MRVREREREKSKGIFLLSEEVRVRVYAFAFSQQSIEEDAVFSYNGFWGSFREYLKYWVNMVKFIIVFLFSN